MAISNVRAGTSSATNGTAPTPALPASLAAGDIMVAVFYSRENVDGTVSISAGWTQIVNDRTSGGLLGVWYRVWQSGDAAPTFTLGGHATGATGDSAIAVIFAYAGGNTSDVDDVIGTISTNVSQQNIGAITGITPSENNCLVVAIGGKRDDWTSVATITDYTELAEPDTVSGADAGLVVDYWIQTTATATGNETFTVTGGANAEGKGVIISFKAQSATTAEGDGKAVGVPVLAGTAQENLQASAAAVGGAVLSGQASPTVVAPAAILGGGVLGGAGAMTLDGAGAVAAGSLTQGFGTMTIGTGAAGVAGALPAAVIHVDVIEATGAGAAVGGGLLSGFAAASVLVEGSGAAGGQLSGAGQLNATSAGVALGDGVAASLGELQTGGAGLSIGSATLTGFTQLTISGDGQAFGYATLTATGLNSMQAVDGLADMSQAITHHAEAAEAA